jgi:hypothetical protein
MDEFKTEKAVYSPTDFALWNANNMLMISPKFQRRPVWRTPAKSFFIDTLLRGMTIPPIYLRKAQNPAKTGEIREVVDGQQRIRAVLGFIEDEFSLATNLQAPWAGKCYSDLSSSQQQQIMNYGFPTEIFKGISDKQIFEVFCRLNMNGVALNKQELRNGTYFGLFKQASYALAYEYLEFWRGNSIFSEQNLARMLEVELTSELLIAGVDGMQDKKKSIDKFYGDFEVKFPKQSTFEKQFRTTMDTIADTFDGDLGTTYFRRSPLFYSLYCVTYHFIFRLSGVQQASPGRQLKAADKSALRDAVVRLSEVLIQDKEKTEEVPKKYRAFVLACQRQTDNLNPRKERFSTLYGTAF